MWLFKAKTRFELRFLNNVDERDLKTPADVINYIEEMSDKLTDRYEDGSVLVVKLDKKDNVLYAENVLLPLDPNMDIDESFKRFYTTKALDFDRTILEGPKIVEADEDKPEVSLNDEPALPESLQNLAQKGTEILQEESKEEVDPEPIVEPKSEPSPLEQVIEQQAQQFKVLQEQLASQQAETESLKQALLEQQSTVSQVVDHTPVVDNGPATTKEIEPEDESSTSSRESDSTVVSEKIIADEPQEDQELAIDTPSIDYTQEGPIADVLSMVKLEFGKLLTDFVAEENKKIEAEIKVLDKRDSIAKNYTLQYDLKKEELLKQSDADLDYQRDSEIDAENERHEKALETIKTADKERRIKATRQIKSDINKQLEASINRAYEKQTQELEIVLKGKKAELEFRQKAMNQGLKDNFKEVLEAFNTKHNEVISHVEESRTPVDFNDYLKRKQA